MMFQSQAADSSSEKEKKASSRAKSGQHHHSIISSDLTIKGNLVCTGDLRIEGRVDGDITCRTLTLGAQPVINSKVTAETVRICGEFTGEVRARKVILTDTAKVKGDIYQDVLQLDKGAAFEGYIGRLGGETAKSEDEVTALKSA
ncbi:MAG: polymer-forming cytoskeletal protein [Kiloniellales bacterium]|nr:polymer-forming cytoskeletal protein [Kiloniellales bacterium]